MELKKDIENRLKIFFGKKIISARKISRLHAEAIKKIQNFTLNGGKRLRAIFTYYGYLAVGGKNKDAILNACIYNELLQSFLLVHDDIIDDDDLRRGKPSLHKEYQSENSKHFGISMAIIAGDIARELALEILLESKFPMERKIKALQFLHTNIEEVCAGEMLDIEASGCDEITKNFIQKIHYYKTATYTVAGPLCVGGILGGANEKTLHVFQDYAHFLGRAFQIQDDILGLFGDEKKLGKPVGSDLGENKKTLLILKALEKASQKEQNIIQNALGNKSLSPEQIQNVREIITRTGSLAYSQKSARALAKRAQQIIHDAQMVKEAKSFLENISDYIVNRNF